MSIFAFLLILAYCIFKLSAFIKIGSLRTIFDSMGFEVVEEIDLEMEFDLNP
jgi:hypothetical protein